MVASAGELVRATFDQSMLEWAQKLGLRCELVEHPHLLATQVAGLEAGAVVSLGVERCGAAELSQAS
jgi:hypothetical protein